MTRRDVDSLLRGWDEVARTAQTPAPALRPERVRARGNGLSALPILVVAVVVVAGIAVFARSSAGPGVGTTPGASVAAPGSGAGSVDDGTLRLTLSADRGTYAEDDPIIATATLEYIGPDAQMTIFTALDQVVFSVTEVGGDRQAGGGSRLSCNRHTLTRGEPVTFPWEKNAAYVPGDPAFAFAEWYATSGRTLRLPAGMWRLSATFEGAEGGCGYPDHTLTADIVVTVVPGPSPVVQTPTTPSNPPYAGPSNVVTCGQLTSFACGGVLALVAAGHRDALAAATRIVVDDTCPPGMVCDRQHAFEALVVVVPPGGIEAAVAHLVTGEDGPGEVAVSEEVIPQRFAVQVDRPGAAPEPIPLLNLDPPPGGTPGPCAAALIEGELIADPATGLAIGVDPASGSSVVTVRWPFGYTARVDALGYALVDDVGATIAHVGDRLQVGGGFAEGEAWGACGGIEGVATSSGG